ncbi:MAG: hypothetical protein AMJ92_03025 [candidate division Zixibacteria bacterium SM23_81]|nr:MAG: hypothetical protein AMJ92_03025 [candidate division Zixibacteria bacterium SM23_81]
MAMMGAKKIFLVLLVVLAAGVDDTTWCAEGLLGGDDVIRLLIQEGSYESAYRRLSDDTTAADSFSGQFQMAYCLLKLERWEEAALISEKLLEDSALLKGYLHYFLAICYAHSGEPEKAQTQLIHLLETEDRFLANEAYQLLAQVYLESGKADEAIRMLQLLVHQPALQVQLPELWFSLGRAHQKAGRLDEAALLFARILSFHPASSAAPGALEELKSIRGKPLSDVELFEAAWVRFHQSRFTEAAHLWSRFAELHRESQQAEEALYLSAQACYQGKQYSQAESKCQLLLQTYPRGLYATSARFLMARCAEADGRTTLATKRYRQFAQDYPWSELAEDALWRLAMLQEQRGSLHQAQREYQALSQKYASRERAEEALWRAGLFAFRLDEDAAAIALFDRLRVRYPQSPWVQGALYWGARAHKRSGGEIIAHQLLDQVVQLDPQGYYAARAKELLDADVLSSVERDSLEPEVFLDEEDRIAPGLDHDFASHLQRGTSLLELGLLPYARRELSKVHLVAHEHPQVMLDLLRFYQKLQLYGDALRLAQQANDHLSRPRWRESLEPFLYPLGYMETVSVEAGKYGLEPYFLMSVIRIESRFDPLAVSRTGAKGLMQIMPSTEKEIGERLGFSVNPASSSFRPELNIRMGAYYLWKQLEAFGWQPEIALAAYNAGPGNVKRWLRRWGMVDPELFVEFIEFPETREFVKRVLATQALYRRIWSARG